MKVARSLLFAGILAGLPAAHAGTLEPGNLKQAGAALHVEIATGRNVGINENGPQAEVGAKIASVMLGDYAVGDWMSYYKSVEGDYVKPAVLERLVLLDRDGGLLVDEDWSAAAEQDWTRQIGEARRATDLMPTDYHVPDYLLRGSSNILLHVKIEKSETYDRGRGYLSANHTAKVIDSLSPAFKAGQTVVLNEEQNARKRFEPPANPDRIVMARESRSLSDGQTKLFVDRKVNSGFSAAGWNNLKADFARVQAAQKN